MYKSSFGREFQPARGFIADAGEGYGEGEGKGDGDRVQPTISRGKGPGQRWGSELR